MISLVVWSYFGIPPLLLPGLEPASPWTPTVLTRVCCLSLKPDMVREVCSHPNSRISAKVQSWEVGLSRVLSPYDHQIHPELRHVSSLHYRLNHQSCHFPFNRLFGLQEDIWKVWLPSCGKAWRRRRVWCPGMHIYRKYLPVLFSRAFHAVWTRYGYGSEGE